MCKSDEYDYDGCNHTRDDVYQIRNSMVSIHGGTCMLTYDFK